MLKKLMEQKNETKVNALWSQMVIDSVIGRTEIYVIENGIRRLIPNMETFFDWDFAKGAVYIISEAELNAISSRCTLTLQQTL